MPNAEFGRNTPNLLFGKLHINPIRIIEHPSDGLKYMACLGGTVSDEDVFAFIANRRKTFLWFDWARTRRNPKIRSEVWNGKRYWILTQFGYRRLYQTLKAEEAFKAVAEAQA